MDQKLPKLSIIKKNETRPQVTKKGHNWSNKIDQNLLKFTKNNRNEISPKSSKTARRTKNNQKWPNLTKKDKNELDEIRPRGPNMIKNNRPTKSD